MSQRHMNDADGLNHGSEVGSVRIASYEHTVIYEYLGKNRYLQAAFCKSVAKLYADKFGMYTTLALSNIAAEEGDITMLEWSKEIGCRWDKSVFVSGAKGGHVDILKFSKNNECPMPSWDYAWIAAAERGKLEVLKFAHTSRHSLDMQCLCEVAAGNGHVNILRWVHEVEGNRYFTAETCEAAAAGGRLNSLQYLRGIGCEWDGETCLQPISKGHVDVLEWALDNGCPWTVREMDALGQTGLHFAENVEVIEFLISRGADINAGDNYGRTPMFKAAAWGTLETVKAFVTLGADVNNIADVNGRTPLDTAIRRGHREIVEDLRAAGARE